MILVATSGDTGKAALEGFKGVDGVSIGVLFPDGGVSDIQRKQMVTTTGDNVQVWAVRGNFDDCQTGVKRTFADEKFTEKLLNEYRIALSSANSINWGRLLPQVVYYISSYAELVAAGKIEAGCPIDVCVPTGNFGNILAAWYAKQIGAPIERLLCASSPTSSTPAPTTSPTASSFSPPLPRWTFSSPPTSSASSSSSRAAMARLFASGWPIWPTPAASV